MKIMPSSATSLPRSLPRLRRDDTLLLIVDVQERLVPAMHDAENVVQNCALLARAARQMKLPIVVTEQYPQRLGATLPAIAEHCSSAAHAKMLFSACIDEVSEVLRESGRQTVLLCGIEAHVCVLQSALDLLDAGYTVFVVRDAISSRTPQNAEIGWARMISAGCLPTSTESAIFELLREAGTPDFKALLPFIK